LALVCTLVPAVTLAQPATEQPAPAPEPPPVPARILPVPAASGDPSEPATAPAPSGVDAKLAGLEKKWAATQKTLDPFAKLKLSGYVQGRYEFHQDSNESLTADGAGQATSQFLVRRARLKVAYAGEMSEYVLQFDATPGGVGLRDAEATFVEPWTPLGLRLTVGQYKWPFGFEVIQSSQQREMPERALVIRTLFPGERDRGVRVAGKWEFLRYAAAVMNGEGTDSKFAGRDSSDHKDAVGRLGVDFETVVGGVSGYYGKSRVVDQKADPIKEIAGTFKDRAKTRYGADLQLNLGLLPIGATVLRGEYIMGENAGKDVAGWYGFLRQDVAPAVALYARVDNYDPDVDAKDDPTLTAGGGVQWMPSKHVRLNATYERPTKQTSDKKDDTLTLQVQASF